MQQSDEAVEMQNNRKTSMNKLMDEIKAQAVPEDQKPKKMIRTTVYLTEEESRKIKMKALNAGKSVSAMIQDYIEQL